MERRLAAILAADVVGYSRLMELDEVGTLAALKTHRKELIDPAIAEHRGRIVKLMGDGTLVEFASVVDAVTCAVVIQTGTAQRRTGALEDRRIELRVGVHLGDIIVEGEDIYGEGVNVAARLEGLAEPGGICLSGDAYRQVRGKVEANFEDLGERKVKNLAEPLRVYRIAIEGPSSATTPGATKPLPLPDKPSIAVLAFDNLSGDPEQEYLADGIAENIITTLSQIPEIFVIARTSTFTYKGKPVRVQEVAEELGVQYVLEGSVQRSGETIRITAQLIDAINGHHLWSQRYDRRLENFFAVLDDITLEIVLALQVKLTTAYLGRGTENLEAWASATKGAALIDRINKDDNVRARVLYEDAVRLDPGYPLAWSDLGWTHWNDARFGWSESREASLAKAVELGEKAMALDERLPRVHTLFGAIHLVKQEYEQAIAFMEKAVALAPNDANRKAVLAFALTYAGRPADAALLLEMAIRLNPHYPPWWLGVLGRAYRLERRYDEAIAELERALDGIGQQVQTHVELAVTYVEVGREAEARAVAETILKLDPSFSIAKFAKALTYRDSEELDRVVQWMRQAGLPQ